MSHDVFISYASRDTGIAEAVCAVLEGRGARCWMAPRDVTHGLHYMEALIDAIYASRLLVLVFSSASNTSPQVVREVERAVSRGILVLPFLVEDARMSRAMQFLISACHWLNATSRPLDPHLGQLAESVTALLKRPQESLTSLCGHSPLAQEPALEPDGEGDDGPCHPESEGEVHPSICVVLEVTAGAGKGKQFAFGRHDTFMVGRSSRAHFQILNDPHISRHQFMIEVSPPECYLRDLGSTNGTSVNGQRVSECLLRDGDHIHCGKTSIKVRVEGSPVGEAAASLAPATAVSMDTTVSAAAPSREGSVVLRCSICGAPARGTLLSNLVGKQPITYVCAACRDERRDEQHPIPGFEVIEEIGHGSLGPVFKAKRVPTGELVALKPIPTRLSREPRAVQLFLREMRLAATLRHPHTVQIVEVGEAGGILWIATDFIAGIDAARLAERLGGSLPWRDGTAIVCQVLDALHYAHGLGLIHRDVKPSNIMVTGHPKAYVARLFDFGLLKSLDEAGMSGITRRGETRGTVPFMPPEQVIDCRFVKPTGDIYQAGATLYWLLTGQYAHDFGRRDAQGALRDPFVVILEDAVVPVQERVREIPDGIAQVAMKALAREPEKRFPDAAVMAAALLQAAK